MDVLTPYYRCLLHYESSSPVPEPETNYTRYNLFCLQTRLYQALPSLPLNRTKQVSQKEESRSIRLVSIEHEGKMVICVKVYDGSTPVSLTEDQVVYLRAVVNRVVSDNPLHCVLFSSKHKIRFSSTTNKGSFNQTVFPDATDPTTRNGDWSSGEAYNTPSQGKYKLREDIIPPMYWVKTMLPFLSIPEYFAPFINDGILYCKIYPADDYIRIHNNLRQSILIQLEYLYRRGAVVCTDALASKWRLQPIYIESGEMSIPYGPISIGQKAVIQTATQLKGTRHPSSMKDGIISSVGGTIPDMMSDFRIVQDVNTSGLLGNILSRDGWKVPPPDTRGMTGQDIPISIEEVPASTFWYNKGPIDIARKQIWEYQFGKDKFDSDRIRRVAADVVGTNEAAHGSEPDVSLYIPEWEDTRFAPSMIEFLLTRLRGDRTISIKIASPESQGYLVSCHAIALKMGAIFPDFTRVTEDGIQSGYKMLQIIGDKVIAQAGNLDEARTIASIVTHESRISDGHIVFIQLGNLDYFTGIHNSMKKLWSSEASVYKTIDRLKPFVVSCYIPLELSLQTAIDLVWSNVSSNK